MAFNLDTQWKTKNWFTYKKSWQVCLEKWTWLVALSVIFRFFDSSPRNAPVTISFCAHINSCGHLYKWVQPDNFIEHNLSCKKIFKMKNFEHWNLQLRFNLFHFTLVITLQNELQNHKKTYDPNVMRDLMDYYLQALENKERGEPIGETFSGAN